MIIKMQMEQKLQDSVGKFIENEDGIRDNKDESSKDLIETHAYNKDSGGNNKDGAIDNGEERDAMKEKSMNNVLESHGRSDMRNDK